MTRLMRPNDPSRAAPRKVSGAPGPSRQCSTPPHTTAELRFNTYNCLLCCCEGAALEGLVAIDTLPPAMPSAPQRCPTPISLPAAHSSQGHVRPM